MTAANNIYHDILGLAAAGAQNFLWLDLPLLGDTPRGAPQKDAWNAATKDFNNQWAVDVQALEGAGIHVTGVDMGKLFTKLVNNPAGYGFTNAADKAQNLNAATDAGYLFWDDLHPTRQGHALVSDVAFGTLTGAPEPASVTLALLGIGALAGLGLRKKSVR